MPLWPAQCFFAHGAKAVQAARSSSGTVVQFNVPVTVRSYTQATAPSAQRIAQLKSMSPIGDAGGPCLAVSDGTNWRHLSFGTLAIGSKNSGFFSRPKRPTSSDLIIVMLPTQSAGLPGGVPTRALDHSATYIRRQISGHSRWRRRPADVQSLWRHSGGAAKLRR
jgi:hypothetical protein